MRERPSRSRNRSDRQGLQLLLSSTSPGELEASPAAPPFLRRTLGNEHVGEKEDQTYQNWPTDQI